MKDDVVSHDREQPAESSPDLARLLQLQETPELLKRLQTLSGSELSVQQRLREEFTADLVPAAMTLAACREKAKDLLPEAERLWLTTTGLEQSTAWPVAVHKAARFPHGASILDLCSGIGVDSAALASRGPVTAVDIDPAMIHRCRSNVAVWRQHGVVPIESEVSYLTADARNCSLTDQLIHVDPDRRGGRSRPVKRLEQYCPNLEWMQNAVRVARGGAIKLGPASNFIQKFPGCEIELISLNGECREATVWFGDLAEEEGYRATVLPAGESISADPLSAWCDLSDRPLDYIFDPDPAVVRSGLIDCVGERLGLRRLDREEEYLTGTELPATAFVRPYRVHAVMANSLKELRRYFRTRPASSYEIKCRRLPVDATAVRRRLPRGEGPGRVVFFLRSCGKSSIVVAERISNPAD